MSLSKLVQSFFLACALTGNVSYSEDGVMDNIRKKDCYDVVEIRTFLLDDRIKKRNETPENVLYKRLYFYNRNSKTGDLNLKDNIDYEELNNPIISQKYGGYSTIRYGYISCGVKGFRSIFAKSKIETKCQADNILKGNCVIVILP